MKSNSEDKKTSAKLAAVTEIISIRKNLLNELDAHRKKLNTAYSKAFSLFVGKVSPWKVGDVIEVTKNPPRKGFKRFVIYDFAPTYFPEKFGKKMSSHMLLHAWGWWLDKNNVPLKWDSVCVYGASSGSEYKISDNQENKKVPEGVRNTKGERVL